MVDLASNAALESAHGATAQQAPVVETTPFAVNPFGRSLSADITYVFYQAAYTMTCLSLDYVDRHGWNVGAYAHNLENSVVANYYVGGVGAAYVNLRPLRTYGVRAGLRF